MNKAAPASWSLAGGRSLTLDRPRIVAILNVTPDSFSDGGRFQSEGDALREALRLLDEGADMLDVGGESTRPGAQRIAPEEQRRRVVPVIEAVLRERPGVRISVDTTRAEVARAALDAGACAVNDVSAATEDDAMLPLVAQRGAGIILMHRLRPPEADRYSTRYDAPPDYRAAHPEGAPTAPGDAPTDPVVPAVRRYLCERADAALRAGVARGAIVIDPGLGFGKDVAQCVALMRAAPLFVATGWPVLSAVSRKSFIGALSGVEEPARRVPGTLAASVGAFLAGVRLFRVHDVAAHREALGVAWALAGEGLAAGDDRPYHS